MLLIVSSVQQGDSGICMHVSVFQVPSLIRLLYNTEQSPLCYTAGPCWLFILNIAVHKCQSQDASLAL